MTRSVPTGIAPEATPADLELIRLAQPFTMASPARQWALLQAVEYAHAREIPGDFVECGVWRGGSSMLAAMVLKRLGDTRRVWMYDTFQGMPKPGAEDLDLTGGGRALDLWACRRKGNFSTWARASLDDVKANMARVNYPHVEYVAGMVEDTLPTQHPDRIAILRLDTDWYASTKLELEILYPLLSQGGVLIIDDYGAWGGQGRQPTNSLWGSRRRSCIALTGQPASS